MVFPHCLFTLFLLFLSFYCRSTPTLAGHATLVDIRNDLPSNPPLKLQCGEGSFDLKAGQHYNRTLPADQGFGCTAVWTPWFSSWDAYDVKRDKGHSTVYWSLKKDGFYLSFDGSKWKFIDYWQTD
ncbi:hypothetical protein RJT34_14019 [Clitoria ternatea]|uniref:S-protein homolog n=1 Tax=Clitoria ternatea TaxID=43366 RepID=A0AAN9JS75_CLITE